MSPRTSADHDRQTVFHGRGGAGELRYQQVNYLTTLTQG